MLVYFADLSHPNHVTKAFPLGISCVAAYAKQELGNIIDIKLFKMPADLERVFSFQKPEVLCLSSYPWNLHLAYTFAKAAKESYPGLIVVFGGPNFPLTCEEQAEFLRDFPAIDFYIFGEGEEGFVELLKDLMTAGMDATSLKQKMAKIQNCIYRYGEILVRGDIKRIENLDKIPSPYISGILDGFFDLPFIPLTETTRGCPFSCTFCGSGSDYKTKVFRYSEERVRENIEYIAGHVKHCDELILADLNFGMYGFDAKTCRLIARLQSEKGYPKIIKASAGKNKPDMVFDAVRVLGNSWHVGLALQSTDADVLSAIKRDKISNAKIIDLADQGKKTDSFTYTEIILGLPNDSKERHYESLRFAINGGFNSVRMYQLFLLRGTELAGQESRKKYNMSTKWRIIPGCVGRYRFFGKEYRVGAPEEVLASNATLSWEDYLECRMMDCIVEIFFNNAWFEEVFTLIKAKKLFPFDLLLYFKNHHELYSEKIQSIFNNFLKHDQANLLNSRKEIEAFLQQPGVIEKYLNGELGKNEILITKALCYLDFRETSEVFHKAVRCFIKENGLLTEKVNDYLGGLKEFNLMRKSGLFDMVAKKYNGYFKYDFKSIESQNFEVDPDLIETSKHYSIEMYHRPEQVAMINKCKNIYGLSLSGLAKLIQRVNFKEIHRHYKQEAVS